MTNQVANTILAHLGHNRFIAMTGAKMFVGDEKSLTFRLPNNTACNGINCITITLNNVDTYDIRFGKVRGFDYADVATARNVYAENLGSAFTSYTGLETSLKAETR